MWIKQPYFVIFSCIFIISYAFEVKEAIHSKNLCGDAELPKLFTNVDQCAQEFEETYFKETGKKYDLLKEEMNRIHPLSDTQEPNFFGGCVLQCAFERLNAVNTTGYPLVEGLLSVFIDGSTELVYKKSVEQAVTMCARDVSMLIKLYADRATKKLIACRSSLALFNCIVHQLTQYCS